jgi:hypothetical protein
MYEPEFFIGNNALTKEKLKIPINECACHWHILGRTGRGKSKFLENFCRAIIDAGKAVVVIDGKGPLVDELLAYCIQEQLEDRIAAVIDPAVMYQRWAPGLNLLEPIGTTDPATHAEKVLEALKTLFEQQGDFMPFLEKWAPATAMPLILKKLTMVEMEPFASPHERIFAKAVFYFLGRELKQTGTDLLGPNLERVIERWDDLKAFGKIEAAIQTAVVQNRAALLTQSPMGEAIFGQQVSTVDWQDVINTGKIVLIKAQQDPRISARLRQSIGVAAVTGLMEAAWSRQDFFPDAWVVADEFQEFVTAEFERGLDLMRHYHLWFVLSHQHLDHIAHIPALLSSIKTNCDGKVYFSISHQDAEQVVYELFDDYIHGDHVKQEINQTKFRPFTKWVEIHSRADSENWLEISSDGEVFGSGGGAAVMYGPDGTFLPGPELGKTVSEHFNSLTQRGSATGGGGSHSDIITSAPITQYEEFSELSNREFYKLDEIVQRCVAWITQQHERKAIFKLKDRKSIPIVTRFVESPTIDPEYEIPPFLEKIFRKCARPYTEVLGEIRSRKNRIVEEYKQAKEAEEKQAAEAQKAKDAEFMAEPRTAHESAMLPGPEPQWDQGTISIPKAKAGRTRSRRVEPSRAAEPRA